MQTVWLILGLAVLVAALAVPLLVWLDGRSDPLRGMPRHRLPPPWEDETRR